MVEAPTCPYCETPAHLVDSAQVYGGRSYGNVWICGRYPECDAYVGVHAKTDEPLGRLADPELRKAKMAAHKAFDPLWQQAHEAYELPDEQGERVKAVKKIRRSMRRRAYAWLAEQLEREEVHIGELDVAECRKVADLCRRASPAIIRLWAKANGV